MTDPPTSSPLDGQDERYTEWAANSHSPRRRSPSAARCPWVVAGKRCRVGYAMNQQCICQRYALTILDHSRMWLDPDGRHVLTSEPYGISDSWDLQGFLTELHELGVRTHISANSPYYPGSTVMLEMTRADP